MGLAGVVGGILWFVLQLLMGAEWGVPGTNEYANYELFNRLWPLLLLLMALGYIGVDQAQRRQLRAFSKRPLRVLLTGFFAMLAGNITEFWFFNTYPYGEMNARSYAWMAFLLGILITLAGFLLLGRATLRAAILPRWSGVLLVLALPAELLFFFIGQSILFATAALSIVMGALILVKASAPRTQ
jgi:hypothetical protein